MKVLSLRQPWLWMMLHAGKNIENRVPTSSVARTKYRGAMLLHASKARGRIAELDYYDGARRFVVACFGQSAADSIPKIDDLPRGVICGHAWLRGILPPADAGRTQDPAFGVFFDERWRMRGQFGLVLADIVETPHVPCTGCMYLFDAPAHVLEALGTLGIA